MRDLDMGHAMSLAEFVDPTVRWCGAKGCLHRGSEHDINNRCLVCECSHFSTRRAHLDIATALVLAGLDR